MTTTFASSTTRPESLLTMIASNYLTEIIPFFCQQQDLLMPVSQMSKGVWVWSLWHWLAFALTSPSSLPASILLLMTPLASHTMAASRSQTRPLGSYRCQSSIAHKQTARARNPTGFGWHCWPAPGRCLMGYAAILSPGGDLVGCFAVWRVLGEIAVCIFGNECVAYLQG